MEQKSKLNWKKFSNTSTYQILFDQENTIFLQNIFSHKLTEFEIENLPSFYIISFVEVLQNYIYYFLKNEQNENNNNNKNEYEQIIKLKNEQIKELKEKLIIFQEHINQKDIALNTISKKYAFLYNEYNELEEQYNIKLEKFKKIMKEKQEDYKEMGDKLIDTFSYLNKLVMISNIDKEPIKEKIWVIHPGNHENRTLKNDGIDILKRNKNPT